ncbi:MAG: DUF2163 domain-containing protein [Pseudomonadota bacterium]
MRQLSSAMLQALQSPSTTICNAWVVTRTDGSVIGLTDHDRVLTVNDIDCRPMDGVDRSGLEANTGTNSDTASITGILSSDAISNQDVENGLFDHAQIEHFMVDWSAVNNHAKLRTHTMGEIRREGEAFVVELRGATGLLSKPNGRHYTRSCSARFCDAQCGMNEAEFSHATTITAVLQSNMIMVDLPANLDPALFSEGLVRLDNQSSPLMIETAVATVDGCRLTFTGNLSTDFLAPATAVLVEGCNRAFVTCRDRFLNAINFRGFPHMPGNYQVLNYVDEETRHDGTPIVP